MADKTLEDIAQDMRDIDFTMLFTRAEGGEIAGRPMSNNGDVTFDGDSWFFTYEDTHTVRDIKADPRVAMSLTGKAGLLGKPPLFLSIEGRAEIIRDRAAFEAHWFKSLRMWFPEGIDTPGMVLLNIHASRIHYWDGTDEGEIRL
ncbi:pyridoxamine 5'-phosphate oxidase family protein [Cereibacter changlensis]|uniref:pyridoxamine 5'-phosphate oxidase family protein n=1 Tax=Cereibacter changlensis TaxID=402884 RepID=UPI00403344E1